MCRSSTHIKLCTCEGLNFSKGNSWQLNKAASESVVVGTFIMEDGSEQLSDFSIETVLEDKLLFDLNNHDVFDFEHEPQVDDLLTINVEMKTFHFIYGYKLWNKVDGLNSQGSYVKSGKVKLTT